MVSHQCVSSNATLVYQPVNKFFDRYHTHMASRQCVLICIVRLPDFEKDFLHKSHSYSFSLVCVTSFVALEVDRLQIEVLCLSFCLYIVASMLCSVKNGLILSLLFQIEVVVE